MKNTGKRIIALLIAVVMIIGILPTAFAANVGAFTDVKDSDWFGPYVAYVSEKGLMNGMSATTFEPNSTCTRAMAATVLYRIAGAPEVAEAASFTDLTAAWYKDAIAWAEDEGVVNGIGGGKFNPDGLVTREQLLTMIWRFAGATEPTKADGIDSYPDAASVSEYAKAAFNWGIENEIINGKDGKLDPQGDATRAEFAKIISVFDAMEEVEDPSEEPSEDPSEEPSEDPSEEPSEDPSEEPSEDPSEEPSEDPSEEPSEDPDDPSDAIIYYTNDIHTYIDKDLSYDTVAALKAESIANGNDTLLIDAGDHAQGTAYG
ncbi:MAG: hypothetical protein E7434_07505, partial [Ruminococcaceae bacterium]|nr:hypothetical protein [Oscillospiraceae bacterium]